MIALLREARATIALHHDSDKPARVSCADCCADESAGEAHRPECIVTRIDAELAREADMVEPRGPDGHKRAATCAHGLEPWCSTCEAVYRRGWS